MCSQLQWLGALVREVVDFYLTYEFFHLQQERGLKLSLRPFSGRYPKSPWDETRSPSAIVSRR